MKKIIISIIQKLPLFFYKYEYLMKNIANNLNYDFKHYSSTDLIQNTLSLLPRSGVTRELVTYLVKGDFNKYCYEYNHKICVDTYYIDDSIQNITQFLKKLSTYSEISFTDLLDIFLFLIDFSFLKNYLLTNQSVIDCIKTLISTMMNHKNYSAYNKKIKDILNKLLSIDSINEIVRLYLCFFESDLENYNEAIIGLNVLVRSNDQRISWLALYRLTYCQMMKREDLGYVEKQLKKLIKTCQDNELGNLYNNLGLTYYYQGKYKKAQKAFYHCNDYFNLTDFENKETSKYFNNLGLLEMELGNYDLCLEIFKKLITVNLKIYKDQPFQYLSDEFDNLGNVYLYKNNYKSAYECFLNAMLRAETTYSKLLSTENYLYAKAKDNVLSIEELNELVTYCNQDKDNLNIDKAQTYYMIGELYYDRNKYNEALTYLYIAYDLQKQYKLAYDLKLTQIIIDQIKVKNKNNIFNFYLFIKYKLFYFYYSIKYSPKYYFSIKCSDMYQYIKSILPFYYK